MPSQGRGRCRGRCLPLERIPNGRACQGTNCRVPATAVWNAGTAPCYLHTKIIASEDAALADQGDRWKECEAELVDAQQKVEELQRTLKEKAGA